jgi:hypothetical protein
MDAASSHRAKATLCAHCLTGLCVRKCVRKLELAIYEPDEMQDRNRSMLPMKGVEEQLHHWCQGKWRDSNRVLRTAQITGSVW